MNRYLTLRTAEKGTVNNTDALGVKIPAQSVSRHCNLFHYCSCLLMWERETEDEEACVYGRKSGMRGLEAERKRGLEVFEVIY